MRIDFLRTKQGRTAQHDDCRKRPRDRATRDSLAAGAIEMADLEDTPLPLDTGLHRAMRPMESDG
jgi:hypothetical protein